MTPAAIYLRVSTGHQTEANQEPECLRLAHGRGWLAGEPIEYTTCADEPGPEAAAVVYREQESSAKVRPVWNAVLDNCRRGRHRAIVIWSLDRFGRSMWETLAAIKELDRLGVSLVSVKEPWCDTGGPVRDLLLAIFAWVAQHERDRLRERTRAGVARARAEGKRLGRPPAPELPPHALALAVRLRTAGFSWRPVADRLRAAHHGAWSAAVLRRAVLKGCGGKDPFPAEKWRGWRPDHQVG